MMSCTQSMSYLPTKQPDATIGGEKRAPSSLVQSTTTIGRLVVWPISFRHRMTSSPAKTPAMPSKRPPLIWVSRWLPIKIGGKLLSVPSRRPKMFPAASISTVNPASLHHLQNRSRIVRSSSDNVRRDNPPGRPLPISAEAWMVDQKRSRSTRVSGFIDIEYILSFVEAELK